MSAENKAVGNNFAYRTATDFTPLDYDKTFDLQHLAAVDLIGSCWAGEIIAHLMVSFGCGGQDEVAISIETCKERTDDYSAIKGFFKQYERSYGVVDEHDKVSQALTLDALDQSNLRRHPYYAWRIISTVFV